MRHRHRPRRAAAARAPACTVAGGLVLTGCGDQSGDRALAADCDEAEETGGRDRMETRTEVLGSPFGPTPATTLQQTYTVDGRPGTGATVVHVVPVGPPRDTVDALEVFGDVPAPVDEPAEESSASRISRVGSARLLVRTYAEGSLASLDGQADEVTATSENILPAMCVSTKTGC